jgi:sarcosine oxidase, subunit gamma
VPEVGASRASPAPEDAVTLREVRLGQAWNLRGDSRAARFVDAVQADLGPLPVEPMTSTRYAESTLLWLGPRSWLFVTGAAAPARDFDASRNAIAAAGGALFDVSASHVAWTISGRHAGRVLNRECPLDLRSRAFPRGRCAQSVLGHINVLVYRPRDEVSFVTMVARSFADDAWHALTTAASSEGHRLGSAVDFQAA